jgi:AcrR family transcriptional regulator
MIEERGYLATTTNHIAKAANLSIALLYKYFPEGKPAILRAIFQGEGGEPLDKEKVSSLAIQDVPRYLETMLLDNIRTHRENARLIGAIEIAHLSRADLFQDGVDINQEEVALIAAALRYAQSFGYSHPDFDIESLSRAVFQMVDGVIHRHVTFKPVFPTDEDLAHFLMDTILRLLRFPESLQ